MRVCLAILALILFGVTADRATAQSCGGENQRPCTVLERIPSCNAGLIERPLGVRCVRPSSGGGGGVTRPCGGDGQRACTVIERIPSCNSGLMEVAGRCETCGGDGERPCPVTVRVPSCGTGLVEDFAQNRCIEPVTGFDRLRARAEEELRVVLPLVLEIHAGFGPFATPQNIDTIVALYESGDRFELQRRLESQPRFQASYELAERLGFNTLAVGISSGGGIGTAWFNEIGMSLDVHQEALGYFYNSQFVSVGFQGMVGNDMVISAFIAPNNCIGGRAQGIGGSFDIGSGIGIIQWFDFSTETYLGFTVSVGAGSIGGGGFYGEATTQVFDVAC